MRWTSSGPSRNVEDRRGQRPTYRRGGTLGCGGIILIFIVSYIMGWNPIPLLLMSGGGEPAQPTGYQEGPVQSSAQEDELVAFVSFVLDDAQAIWTKNLPRYGVRYRDAKLVIFRDSVASACGFASAATGPFYCPADEKIYIDLGFYDELAGQFNAPGDFAQAYVIAHEIGHHVQNLLGISEQVAARRGRPDYNQYSVRLELQADYLAGVWANQNQRYLDRGDIEEAMRAANQIGDDAIQKRTQGRVVPHAFTHGTSEQRMRWFERGLDSGRIEDGDTFDVPYESL